MTEVNCCCGGERATHHEDGICFHCDECGHYRPMTDEETP